MAENKTNNPEQEKNLGGQTGNEGQQQQAPGRNLNDDQSGSQRGADRGGNQGTGRTGQGEDDIEQGGGGRGESQGGQNR